MLMGMSGSSSLRIGYGEDAHRLVANRPLVLGNITVPSPHGSDAHSDGDVILHALCDALLSSCALGDIGHYFPPSDQAFKDIDSAEILAHVLTLLHKKFKGFTLINIAAVVTLDAPKLGPYRTVISQKLAELLALPTEAVGLTFKTSEGLAPNHVQARVMVLMQGVLRDATA